MMEIDPNKFMQNAGRIIRHNSFKRGNTTALRLLDMSQGNIESQENPQTQPPHMYEAVDKEGPADEEYLLSKLDTENVEHKNTQEVGNLFSNKQEAFNDEQRSNISKYNLRSHPKPNVRLNSMRLDNQINLKSILKSGYTYYYLTVDDLLLLDSSQVRATKKAIKLHRLENEENFAIKYPNLEEILFFKFKNGISTLLANYER